MSMIFCGTLHRFKICYSQRYAYCSPTTKHSCELLVMNLVLPLTLKVPFTIIIAANVDQDQAPQNMQPDLRYIPSTMPEHYRKKISRIFHCNLYLM